MASVGASAVAPPDDVVQFAAVVVDGAAGDGAGGVEPAECSSLVAVGDPGGPAEVEVAGCVQDDPVGDHDGVASADVEQFLEHRHRQLDGKAGVDRRAPVDGGLGGVDDHDGIDRRSSRPGTRLGQQQLFGGEGVDEALAFDGVARCILWDPVGGDRRRGSAESLCDRSAGRRVEHAGEVEHVVAVDPRAHPTCPPLTSETLLTRLTQQVFDLASEQIPELACRP